MMPMRSGGFTAVMDRPTSSTSSVGCSASIPGTSNSATPTTRLDRSSLTTRFSPINDTYQYDPSGSTTTWWGFAFGPNPSCFRSTTSTTSFVPESISDTVASSWLQTYTSGPVAVRDGAAPAPPVDAVAQPAASTAAATRRLLNHFMGLLPSLMDPFWWRGPWMEPGGRARAPGPGPP